MQDSAFVDLVGPSVPWEAILTIVIAAAAVIGSLYVGVSAVVRQIAAKRIDDRRAANLQRLERQLSDLYGPLYAQFEIGDRQWRAFLEEFGPADRPKEFLGLFPTQDVKFTPPDASQLAAFRLWMHNVFMPNNLSLERAILENAELVVGETLPRPFLDFCVHVAALKASVALWNEQGFERDDWENYIAIFPHPGRALHKIITASFAVLKEEQAELLSNPTGTVNERALADRIKLRA